MNKTKERIVGLVHAARTELQTLSHSLRLSSDALCIPRTLYLRVWILSEFPSLRLDSIEDHEDVTFDAREMNELQSSLASLADELVGLLRDDGSDSARRILDLTEGATKAFERLLTAWYEAFHEF